MNEEVNIKALITSIIVGNVIFVILGVLNIMYMRDALAFLICITSFMIMIAITITIYDYCVGKIDEYKERKRSINIVN